MNASFGCFDILFFVRWLENAVWKCYEQSKRIHICKRSWVRYWRFSVWVCIMTTRSFYLYPLVPWPVDDWRYELTKGNSVSVLWVSARLRFRTYLQQFIRESLLPCVRRHVGLQSQLSARHPRTETANFGVPERLCGKTVARGMGEAESPGILIGGDSTNTGSRAPLT